jgi:hypothetical protein
MSYSDWRLPASIRQIVACEQPRRCANWSCDKPAAILQMTITAPRSTLVTAALSSGEPHTHPGTCPSLLLSAPPPSGGVLADLKHEPHSTSGLYLLSRVTRHPTQIRCPDSPRRMTVIRSRIPMSTPGGESRSARPGPS